MGSVNTLFSLLVNGKDGSVNSWPTDLFEFAYMRNWDAELANLAGEAESEDWGYQNSQSGILYPILSNYVRFTYERVAEELKIAVSQDAQYACFNTGLVTRG